jgi:hypothetical protein
MKGGGDLAGFGPAAGRRHHSAGAVGGGQQRGVDGEVGSPLCRLRERCGGLNLAFLFAYMIYVAATYTCFKLKT